MGKLILGADAGNHTGKFVGQYGEDSFKTNICNWFERDVEDRFGNDDMEFEINGRKGFAGSIAEYEDEFGDGTTFGDTKAHEDTKIRILLGVYRYIEKYCPGTQIINLVTGQPISNHKDEEKNKIIQMLKGHHNFLVNKKRINFYIEDVKVAPEGSSAFWANPQMGQYRIVDVGSGTVNMATLSDKRHVHKSSGTLNTGMETIKNKSDYEGVARAIFQNATKLKWKKNDDVWVCGGVTEQLLPYLLKYFPNATAMQVHLKRDYDVLALKPVFANATAFYNMAKGTFE
ncbi:hypothetical protein PVJ1_00040 [Psychrobacillus phage PVJ1]|nr:hypothetical protein PVJ1_00040 [Psychrobacillus phage PVJ1]